VASIICVSLSPNNHAVILSSKVASSHLVVVRQLLRRYVSRSASDYARSSHSPSKQITAAIIALLNDARLRAGKPTLGFLNPWIYSSGYKGFTDITAGQSDGCNGNNTQTGAAVNGVSWNYLTSLLETTT
jgi:hypothetical protein